MFSFCRLSHKQGANNILISALTRKHHVPKTTLCKRVTGRVLGQGHQSGGKGKGRVLTSGKSSFVSVLLLFQTVHITKYGEHFTLI